MARFALAALIVAASIVLVPFALMPGINSADLLVFLAPFGVVWVFARKLPAGDEVSPQPSTLPPVESPAGFLEGGQR
ncbi:hypothetical protein [Microbacterium sp. NPDC080220]|uniref:hypothetical protein n=1 Tax=Microbacterium sp. NPDC080220 TaxID=3161017 RepID=UPI00343A5389